MSLFQWDESLSVQVPSIDSQHQALIAMINELDDALSRGYSAIITGSIIEKLLVYAEHHFSYEEHCMEQCAFAQIETHRCQHDALLAKVKDFKASYALSTPGLDKDLMEFLTAWLQNHIKKSDKQYSSHFAQSGIV